MNLTKNFTSRRQSWRDSRQDCAEVFATVNLLLGKNLGEIRGSIPARFWPPGLLLPGENLGVVRGRNPPRFWPPGLLLPAENLGEVHGRNRAKILAAGIFASQRESWRDLRQDPGEILAVGNFISQRESCRDSGEFPAGKKNPGSQNLAGILTGFPPRSRQDPAKIPVLILEGLPLTDN